MELYETLPIVPLRDVVVFPHMMMPFVIGRPSSTRALEHALLKDKRIFLAAQHDAAIDDPQPNDIYTMGCVANIVQSLKLPDGNIKVLVEGVERGKILQIANDEGFFRVSIRLVTVKSEPSPQVEQAISRVTQVFEQYVKLFEYENVKLRFTDDALEAIAESALERKIGARGLRMIIEDIMLELMYTLPGQKKIRECVITREVVESKEKPITVIEKAG